MKKILFMVFAAFLMAGTAMAQLPVKKGNMFVNADLSNLNLSFGGGSTSFALGAHGGYFLADNLALMAGLGIGTRSFEGGGSSTDFDINAGARYYFAEQSKGSFFANGLLGVNKWTDLDATFGLTLGAGYALFLNEHVSLEPMVNLQLPFSSGSDVTFSIGGGISVYF